MLLPIIAEEVKDLMKVKQSKESSADEVNFAKLALGAISVLKSKLMLAEKNKGSELTIEEEYKIAKKEYDETWDSYLEAREGGREDAADQEHEKNMVIGTFKNILESKMPKQLTEDEIRAEILKYAEELDVNRVFTKKETGLFMKELKVRLAGKADMKEVNKILLTILV